MLYAQEVLVQETREWTHSKYILSKFEGEHQDPREHLSEQAQQVPDINRQLSSEMAMAAAGMAEMG